MRILFLLGTLFLLSHRLLAQSGGMLNTTRDRINFSGLVVPATGVLYGVAGESGKLIGDTYYDTTFQAGNIRFYGRIGGTDSLGGVPVRYDLLNQDIEVRAGAKDVRSAKAPSVRYFVMNNRAGSTSQFVNVREYRGDADGLVGFFEQVVSGKLPLLLRHTIFVRRGNFNAALNVGTKDDEIVKKKEWFVGQGKKAVSFTPGKKALLELMADQQPAIEAFLKDKKPDLKKDSGLATIFAYYNSL